VVLSGRDRLEAAGVDDPRIESEVLLCHALSITREVLYARLREPVAPGDGAAFAALLDRRLRREPSAYITGHREFYGLDFICTPAALIPRPETELLVDEALAWLKEQRTRNRPYPTIADVGTGCGAIAVSIAMHAPEVRVIAIDTSRKALNLARRNAEAHGVAGRIAFVRGDLLGPLRAGIDVIVANLPYIASDVYETLQAEIHEHEPREALLGGTKGTEVIERLLAEAPALLRPGGLLVGEHAWDQGESLRTPAGASFPGARIETKRDLAGRERVLAIEV
jgi:release factor glutamine methyltransferase